MPRMNVWDAFKNLKTSIVGTDTERVDHQIDSALSKIQAYSSITDRNRYIETLKSLMTNVGGSDPKNEVIEDLKQLSGVDALGQGDRIARYNQYEQIVSHIAYCKRALRVLVDNILSPDDITKRSIRVLSSDNDTISDNDTEATISKVHQILQTIKFNTYLDSLVEGTLKKGDYFIEIMHSPKGENALMIVTEGSKNFEDEQSKPEQVVLESLNPNKTETLHKKLNINVTLESSGSFGGVLSQKSPITTGSGFTASHSKFVNKPQSVDPREDDIEQKVKDPWEEREKEFKSKFDNDDEEEIRQSSRYELKDIYLTFHDPKYVVRLETERFRTCLGYLVFPKIGDGNQQLASLWSVQSNSVDAVCLRIIEMLEKNLKAGKDKLSKHGDLRKVVINYLKDIKDGEDLVVRYVPPEMMSHWRLNVDKFDPYGESIFDSVSFDSKLYMALKTSMTIKRLTSATDKRVIKVETGLPRNAKNLVDMMREGLRKRKISIDQFGSVDTIPSHITTFEDIYIPTRDGKEFVSIDSMQFGPDPQQDTEPLKLIRDNIVANLYVPAPFLGLEENTSNRALLTQENIIFARTVVAYQREFSIMKKDLVEKIYELIYGNASMDLDRIEITFPSPKTAAYEHENEYLEQVNRILETLSQLGASKKHLRNTYLPDYPWQEMDKEKAGETIENEMTGQQEDAGAAGGYAGF